MMHDPGLIVVITHMICNHSSSLNSPSRAKVLALSTLSISLSSFWTSSESGADAGDKNVSGVMEAEMLG